VATPPELLSRLADGFRQQKPADHPVVALDRERRAARRRRARWLAGAAAAVVVLAFAGIASVSLLTGGGGENGSARNADSAPKGAAPRSPAAKGPNHAQIAPEDRRPTGGVRLAVSGTDNTVDTLSRARDQAGQPTLSGAAAGAVPSALRPLTDPGRLDRCLHQLGASGGYTASLVDFAMFLGRPAAVIVGSAGTADRISVVGPGCGTDGAHVRYQTSSISVHTS
jgi:hypothetical protein